MVGVLALQGDFEAHRNALAGAGLDSVCVRGPAALDALDSLVIPGGESTTIAMGIEREGLAGPLREFAASGRPVLGTCAGMILLGRDHLDVLDMACRRNAFGRQLQSFEADLDLIGVGPMHAVFIRAPWVEEAGPEIDVLAEIDGHPVAVAQGNVTAVAFHPELTTDRRLHARLAEQTPRVSAL